MQDISYVPDCSFLGVCSVSQRHSLLKANYMILCCSFKDPDSDKTENNNEHTSMVSN